MERRSLYYWSKLYNDQLKAGEDYGKLNKAIAINLLDFPFQKAKKARTVCQLVDLKTREIISDLLEIHFLSLPLLSPGIADLSCALTRWLLFLNHRTDQSVREEITLLDAEINQASKDLEQLKSDKEARRFYELREKALLDERSLKAFAREEGEAKGREEIKIEVARKLFEKDMTEDFIQEITGLGVETLRNLKTELDQN